MRLEHGLLDWIGELTAAGYDIVGTGGDTARGDGWNANHPMPSLVIHFQNDKKRDFVLKAYATNSRNWTIYANAFSGKAPNRYFGFDIVGKKETEIGDYEALLKFLGTWHDPVYVDYSRENLEHGGM